MLVKDIYDYPFGKIKFCNDTKSYYINTNYWDKNGEIPDYDFKYSLGNEYHILSSESWLSSGGNNFIVDFKNQIIYSKPKNVEYAKFFVKYFPWCWGV